METSFTIPPLFRAMKSGSIRRRVKPGRELVVVTSLPSFEDGSRVRLTSKLVEGAERYVEFWGDPVRLLLPRSATRESTGNLDEVLLERASLGFAVDVVDLGSPAMFEAFSSARVVMGGADYRLLGVAKACAARGVPYVFNSEYSLKTRWQIARTAKKNPLRLLRALHWEWQTEQGFLREVSEAVGVQCNGTPTYDAYEKRSRSPLLYFDSRTTRAMLGSAAGIPEKVRRRRTGASLRLAFSGRLTPMKGADDLPFVARELARLGVDFSLDICGEGPSRVAMERNVRAFGLDSRVRFRGVLDFSKELLPFVERDVDLFVCCHRQGDPSCTYLETLGCGVPIAGYANEAFRGLLERVEVGVASPLGRPKQLAARIAELARPGAIPQWERWATTALAFAGDHTFEATFARRIEHLRACAEGGSRP